MQRREVMKRFAAALVPAACTAPAAAQQAYPGKAVRVLVGVAPGGVADAMGRLFAQKLGEALGQTFFVENKPGAGGTLAADAAAKAPADGYTLLASTPTVMIVAPRLYKQIPFVPERDFEPVVLLGGGPLVLVVHADVPAKSVAELVAHLKRNPGRVAFASGGQGTAAHLTAEMFAKAAGVQMLHSPYKGDGQGVNDLLGGQVQVMFTAPTLVEPHVRSGRLKLLAVTSRQRMASAPATPTLHESGFSGFESLGWIGIYAPAKTPATVTQRIASEWQRIRRQPDVIARFDAMGMGAIPSGTPQEFATFQQAERERWARVIQDAGIQPE